MTCDSRKPASSPSSFAFGLRWTALALSLVAVAVAPRVAEATSVTPPAAAAATASAASAPAAEQNDDAIGQEALNAFQARHKAVLKLIADKASAQALQHEVDQVLDYAELAQSALGGNEVYAATCKTRCAEFESLLSRLIRENYLRMLRQAKGDQVQYAGVAVSPKTKAVKITTKVKTNQAGNKTIVVDYIVRKQNQRWLAVDIVTEGVSLRKTYRYEFGKILEKPGTEGGIDGVIRKIQEKLKEIEAPAAAPAPAAAAAGKSSPSNPSQPAKP